MRTRIHSPGAALPTRHGVLEHREQPGIMLCLCCYHRFPLFAPNGSVGMRLQRKEALLSDFLKGYLTQGLPGLKIHGKA